MAVESDDTPTYREGQGSRDGYDHVDEHGGVSKPAKKAAKRRILSCETCRRVKTRCEYSPQNHSCNRCLKLRIQCSLRASPFIDTHVALADSIHSGPGDEKTSRVEASIAELKGTVDKIWSTLQAHNLSSIPRLRPINGQSPSTITSPLQGNGSRLEELEFPHLSEPNNEGVKSSPIMMVRKFRSSHRRLYKTQPVKDIIDQGILDEGFASILAFEFVRRQGPMLQIESLSDLTLASDLRRTSPLLFAVCCLQGLRFYDDAALLNTPTHRQLYEEVRDMLGQVVLASPLPIEELYAMLIMCTFEAAPKPVFEYIESWLLSGMCAQHAVLSIDFANIVLHVRNGQLENIDRRCLSLWNNICLANLRFAVGTGTPPAIPADYIKQCPAILNLPEASIDDGMVLAEILLFSTLYYKLNQQRSLLLDPVTGRCEEIDGWKRRWKHLLGSPKAAMLRFSQQFASLVLARRSFEVSLEQQPLDSTPSSSPRSHSQAITQSFRTLAHRSAVALAHIFLAMPPNRVQELPKFHHISIAYCALVLSEFNAEDGQPSDDEESGLGADGMDGDRRAGSVEGAEEVLALLHRLQTHYAHFSPEIPPAMKVAAEKVGREVAARWEVRHGCQTARAGCQPQQSRQKRHEGRQYGAPEKMRYPKEELAPTVATGPAGPDNYRTAFPEEAQALDGIDASGGVEGLGGDAFGVGGVVPATGVGVPPLFATFPTIEDFFGGEFLGFAGDTGYEGQYGL